MLSEITPVDLRGRYMGLITLTFAAGQLYGLFIASFTLDSLSAVIYFSQLIIIRVIGEQ